VAVGCREACRLRSVGSEGRVLILASGNQSQFSKILRLCNRSLTSECMSDEYSFSLCEAGAKYLDLALKLRELARACPLIRNVPLNILKYPWTTILSCTASSPLRTRFLSVSALEIGHLMLLSNLA